MKEPREIPEALFVCLAIVGLWLRNYLFVWEKIFITIIGKANMFAVVVIRSVIIMLCYKL